MMQESPFYERIIQRGVERGVQQGSRETNIKNILSVLTERFPLENVDAVAHALESIQDMDQLTLLHRKAVSTPSVEKFLQIIDT